MHFECWKWNIVQFRERYYLILNFMAATHLKKKFGQGHVYHCVVSCSFYSSLKTSGNWGDELLDLWERNIASFLSDMGFYFFFENIWWIMKCKIQQSLKGLDCRPVQHPDFSTMKQCCCNRSSVRFSIVLLNFARLSLKRPNLDITICCSKTCMYPSGLMVPLQMLVLKALMHPHTIRDAGFWTEHWWRPW